MNSLKVVGKTTVVVAGVTVAVPYAVAILSNVLYGWPIGKNKYSRALHPKKVIALNIAVLDQLARIKYAGLALRWKYFYSTVERERVTKDIPFGMNNNCLDIYIPSVASLSSADAAEFRLAGATGGGIRSRGVSGGGGRSVVVFVYGGTWSSGDKSMYGMMCAHLADVLQAVVICPNYSTYPKGFVDDMVQDLNDIVIWVRQHAAAFSANKDKIVLIGHSAGAHLIALTTLELAIKRSSVIGQELNFDEPEVVTETTDLKVKLVSKNVSQLPLAETYPSTLSTSHTGLLSHSSQKTDIRVDEMHSSGAGSQSFFVVPHQGQDTSLTVSQSSVRSNERDPSESFIVVSDNSNTILATAEGYQVPTEKSIMESAQELAATSAEADPLLKLVSIADPVDSKQLSDTTRQDVQEGSALRIKGATSRTEDVLDGSGEIRVKEELQKTDSQKESFKACDILSSETNKESLDKKAAQKKEELQAQSRTSAEESGRESDETMHHVEACGIGDELSSIRLVIGLAGVYDIAAHYEFEAGRGIEDVSTMARAMYGPEHFNKFSPSIIATELSKQVRLPPFVLLHGDKDTTVPLSSSIRFGETLWQLNRGKTLRHSSQVEVAILPGCSHTDICLDVMMEGRPWHDAVVGEIMRAVKKYT